MRLCRICRDTVRDRSADPRHDDRERGSAAVEFIFAGLILLVPLVYLIVTLGLIQGQAMGVEAGARHIARTIAAAPDAAAAAERTASVLQAVTDEYGLDDGAVEVRVACLPSTGACPRAGGTIVVTVRTAVALPLVPPVLGLDSLAVIPVEASSGQRMSRLWEGG